MSFDLNKSVEKVLVSSEQIAEISKKLGDRKSVV